MVLKNASTIRTRFILWSGTSLKFESIMEGGGDSATAAVNTSGRRGGGSQDDAWDWTYGKGEHMEVM